MRIPSEVLNAQVIFVNHSGGKDSQAMLAALVAAGFKDKLVVIHSDLGEMEWEPMEKFIQCNSMGCPIHIIKPTMSFFDLCRKYKRLPSGQARFCTSDLKTQPIGRWIKQYCAENNITNAVNCIGIRSAESLARSKKEPWKVSKLANKSLNIMEWYPIFNYTLEQVWETISAAEQTPHRIYSEGFSRLSCVFCVFGRISEHQLAAKKYPELFQKMVALEKELGKSIRLKQKNNIKSNKYLDEYCN